MPLTQKEINRRIKQGAALRQARSEKRKLKEAEQARLQQILETAKMKDSYSELSLQVKAAADYLKGVIESGKEPSLERIPEIVKLFVFDDDKGARQAYVMCREEYRLLILRCWHFHFGEFATLGKTAFTFWDRMLSFPEVQITGVIICSLLEYGLIFEETISILTTHKQKFLDAELGGFLNRTAKRLLRQRGVMDFTFNAIKPWTKKQIAYLEQIAEMYEVVDLRMLEDIAEDSVI